MNDNFYITRENEIRLFAVLIAGLLLFFAISMAFDLKVDRGDNSTPSETAVNTFPEVTLRAKAAYVYDVRNQKVLFSKNENTRLPLASLTKIMSALVAREINPDHGTIVISDNALSAEGDSGLLRDEKWSLKNLLDFSLLASSNDGMRAVALALGALSSSEASPEDIVQDFVMDMNMKAKKMGLGNTLFLNETGLDLSPTQAGAYGTAKDMSMLIEYILSNQPELLNATKEVSQTFSSLSNTRHRAENTNNLAREIPGLIASKTGFTDTAGGNLVIAFDPDLGRPIIVVVLGSSERGRFEDVEKLVEASLGYISK